MQGTGCCWICLQSDPAGLSRPCKCPRQVHADCLALWQLHSAGTAEEHNCRSCSDVLPDWRQALGGGMHHNQTPVVAVMFGGKEWRLRVAPTPKGAVRFQKQIELITGLPFNDQVHIKFYCESPTGTDVALQGTRCLEAAIHCAALHSASQRQSSTTTQLPKPRGQNLCCSTASQQPRASRDAELQASSLLTSQHDQQQPSQEQQLEQASHRPHLSPFEAINTWSQQAEGQVVNNPSPAAQHCAEPHNESSSVRLVQQQAKSAVWYRVVQRQRKALALIVNVYVGRVKAVLSPAAAEAARSLQGRQPP